MRGLVLFDLDGTLVDSAPGLACAANSLRLRQGLPALPFAALREHCGSGASGLIWAGLRVPATAPCFARLKHEFLQTYGQVMIPMSTPFKGVFAMLEELHDRGIAWGIVTNKALELAQPLCEAQGLSKQAGCIVSGQTLGFPKPAPDALLHAISLLGYDTKETIYVGDDVRDARAAANAGIGFIAAAWGYTGSGDAVDRWEADAVARTLESLPDLAAALLS